MQKPVVTTESSTLLTTRQALRNGFFINALNLKTTLFIISTYTQIINGDTSKFILVSYAMFMPFAHFVWFGSVAFLFSNPKLRAKMLNNQVVINRVIGLILGLLGVLLLMTNLN